MININPVLIKLKKIKDKTFAYILLSLFAFLLFFTNNTFAGWNIYQDASLKDINLSTLDFNWYPIKVNISKYFDSNKNKYVDWKLNKTAIDKKNFVEFSFEDWEKVTVPVTRLLFSKKEWGKLSIDADLIIDMPLYLKDKINYWYAVKANIKLLSNKWQDTNNSFLLNTWIPYIKSGKTIWLIYNTNDVTTENQFLPRKVLVKLYDWTKLLRTQVIDVFKEGKMSVNIKADQNITQIKKVNFYVVWNTNEKDYWYANWPVIDSITCPDKITTATTCTVNIEAFDSWKVKLYIQDKYNKNKYQFWSWNIQATGWKIKKTFMINPALWYPDGEYQIIWNTYKNWIEQQLYNKNGFVIDRFKPSFAEVFPTLYVPDNVSWSATIDVKVSERLKADPIWLKCDLPVTNIKRDNANPLLYHITVNVPSSKDLQTIKCNLTDIGLNTNTQYLYLKRYKDNWNMWITNINSITNGLDMNVKNRSDKFILAKINSLWSGKISICSNGTCSDKVSGIETYQNNNLSSNREILISGNDNWTTIYKLYPNTKVYNSWFKSQIINITSDYLWNYWEVDKEWNYYKNNVLLWTKQNLTYYNIYKGSYVIEYYKGDWLYIDTKKIDNSIVWKNYLWIDIIKPIDNNHVYMVWLDNNNNNLNYFKVDLLNKKVTKILSVKVNDYNSNSHPSSVDFAYYLNKIILLASVPNSHRSFISIMPLPKIIIENIATNDKTTYIAHNNLKFWAELYEKLWLKALVKWYMLPSVKDCWGGKTITIGWVEHKFDNDPWCNIKELGLDQTSDTKLVNPKMYYQQSLDNYTFNRKFHVYVNKFWIEKDLWEKKLKLQNQPKEYWLWFVNANEILTNKNSPGWDYIKYNSKTFLSLPQMVHYSVKDDLKNKWFYVYKRNLKLQSLENKTWLYYPVVVYKTAYNTSEVRVLGISTITGYITDPKTWEYKAVKRVIFNKPYKIDTIAPIFFDIKSDNTNPSVGDKIKISFKTTEPVEIKHITIWNVNVYNPWDITKTMRNNIYYYELSNVTITNKMFDKQNQLWLSIGGDDRAMNYNERKVNVAWLRWWLSLSSLQVWKIKSAGSINIKNFFISNDKKAETMNNVKVLTNKKLITNKEITTTLPKTADWKVDMKKLFNGKKIYNIINTFNNNSSYLKNYFITTWKNLCNYNYSESNIQFSLWGDCWFIRNRVYNIDSDLRINKPLKYEWYSTLFVNGDVYINANIITKKGNKQNILWIITTGNVYISPNVTHVQAVIKTEKNIYVNK